MKLTNTIATYLVALMTIGCMANNGTMSTRGEQQQSRQRDIAVACLEKFFENRSSLQSKRIYVLVNGESASDVMRRARIPSRDAFRTGKGFKIVADTLVEKETNLRCSAMDIVIETVSERDAQATVIFTSERLSSSSRTYRLECVNNVWRVVETTRISAE